MSYTIGIDLGGTIIKIGLLHHKKLLDRVDIAAKREDGLGSQLPDIKLCIDRLLAKNRVENTALLGIGFSFAGLVNAKTNRIISTNKKYDDGPNINLVEWAYLNWGCSLFAENDARMALFGEWQHGAGVGCENIVLVTLGTGIGSAVLLEGNMLRGKHFQAGNLGGHFTINHAGVECTCGNIGCMESEVSTWRLPEIIKGHKYFKRSWLSTEERFDFKTLFNQNLKDDVVVKDVLDHCYSAWSAGITSMIHAFDPEMVILSGGIMKSGSVIIPELERRIHKNAWTPWGEVQIKQAKHINDAALFGSDYLVRVNLKE